LTAIGDLAGWLAGLLDALGIDRFAVAGHSLGSLIALEVAAGASGRVTRLALLGISYPMVVGEVLLDAARADDERAIDMIMVWGHAFASRLGGNPVAGVHIVNVARSIMGRAKPSVLFTDLNACNSYTDGLAAAARIDCPVTMILGESDRMTPPRGAEELAQALPDRRVEIINDCGHMMMSEQPEATHQSLVRAFI
jgi:pimeloyl-ACP methyl ester carboxylesterase